MPFTRWRNEEYDLLGGFSNFENHYNMITKEINYQLICFEPFPDEVEIAEIVTENESSEDWDALTPGVQ